jgi:hypothetical protein
MATDTPPTPAAPKLPDNYDPNMGVIAPGLVEAGNLELNGRPLVQNDDGTHSSEYSFSFGTDKGETLVPTVVGGRFLTPDGKKPQVGSQADKDMHKAAQDHYNRTGEHLGIFDTPENADTYASAVHNRRLRPGLTPSDVQGAGGKTVVPPTLQKVSGVNRALENEGTMNQGKADYKNWLYKNSPAEFKKAYPAEFLYRKGYNYAEDAITEPATHMLTGKAREEIAPKIHELAETGLGLAGAVKPGQTEPVIKQGVIAPEGGGLDPEDIEIAGGKTIVPPTPRAPEYPTVQMSPQEFLDQTSAHESHVSPEAVKSYRTKIQKGEPLEPLEIHHDADGNIVGANGRHRAAAMLAEKVPSTAVRRIKTVPPPEEERLDLGKIDEPNYAEAAKSAGVEFRGVQKGMEGLHPGLAMFQDPKSGTSVGVRLDEWSPDKLQEHIDAARERMAPKTAVKPAKRPQQNFQVIDTQTGDVMSSHSTAARARLASNMKDLEHGGTRYTVKQRPNK